MRTLPPAPSLPVKMIEKLLLETAAIESSHTATEEAAKRYAKARKAQWFLPVVQALRSWSGPGERCMFCSGSESSDVEHFRPKAVFPLVAMDWANYRWACTVCNRFKGKRFPPQTEPGAMILDPVGEQVWKHLFIDEFGLLTARWDTSVDAPDARAISTIRILALDRQALQQSRQFRLKDLRQQAQDSLKLLAAGKLTQAALKDRVAQWLKEPYQPDVADYFLSGPGKLESPFKRLLQEAGLSAE